MDPEVQAALAKAPPRRTEPPAAAAPMALLVPALLGGVAGVALVLETGALLPLVVLGFPLVFLGAEDALATGMLPWAFVWAVVAAPLWWWAGRWAGRAAARSLTGFTWGAWARALAVVGMILFTGQIMVVIGLSWLLSAVT